MFTNAINKDISRAKPVQCLFILYRPVLRALFYIKISRVLLRMKNITVTHTVNSVQAASQHTECTA